MQIKAASLKFTAMSGIGPRQGTVKVNFPLPVQSATAALTGFTPEFGLNIDHNYGLLQIQVVVPRNGVNGSAVTVDVIFALRDSSNNWFHHYAGTIFFVVIAE